MKTMKIKIQEPVMKFIRSLMTLTVAALLLPASTRAQCIAPPAGLVAWWPGDGDASDVLGQNNATAQGGLAFTPGMAGEAFDLNGTSAFAQVALPTGLPLAHQPRTVALWFKTTRNLVTATESASSNTVRTPTGRCSA
jgi:hypothetical protein